VSGKPDQLFEHLYGELHRLAGSCMRSERAGHTLQPTALVHEAYVKLSAAQGGGYADRTHFLAIASRVMRQVLVDHARARGAAKRGGGATRITLDESALAIGGGEPEILEIDMALEKLAREDQDAAGVAVLRFFGGLTELEIAGELDRSERWVRDQWVYARAWLKRELDPDRK
jgi:RNA polymerase sigma-70 factor, ECF subfamily